MVVAGSNYVSYTANHHTHTPPPYTHGVATGYSEYISTTIVIVYNFFFNTLLCLLFFLEKLLKRKFYFYTSRPIVPHLPNRPLIWCLYLSGYFQRLKIIYRGLYSSLPLKKPINIQ